MIENRSRRKNNRRAGNSLASVAGLVVALTVFVTGFGGEAAGIAYAAEGQVQSDGGDAAQTVTEPFSYCRCYEPERIERYRKYQNKHLNFSPNKVVWQVNVNLDYGDYNKKTVETADTGDGKYILVSKKYRLPKNYVPKNLVELPGGYSARKPAAKAYMKLMKAAKKKGYNLEVQSAYRSYERQKELYNRYKKTDGVKAADRYSARPGFSEHQTGLAIDVNSKGIDDLERFTNTSACKWLAKNAHKFGFIIRYTEQNENVTGFMAESWHIRYLGKKHATVIYEKGIKSYEEYKVKYIDHQE